MMAALTMLLAALLLTPIGLAARGRFRLRFGLSISGAIAVILAIFSIVSFAVGGAVGGELIVGNALSTAYGYALVLLVFGAPIVWYGVKYAHVVTRMFAYLAEPITRTERFKSFVVALRTKLGH